MAPFSSKLQAIHVSTTEELWPSSVDGQFSPNNNSFVSLKWNKPKTLCALCLAWTSLVGQWENLPKLQSPGWTWTWMLCFAKSTKLEVIKMLQQLWSTINQLWSTINQLWSTMNQLWSEINRTRSLINHQK